MISPTRDSGFHRRMHFNVISTPADFIRFTLLVSSEMPQISGSSRGRSSRSMMAISSPPSYADSSSFPAAWQGRQQRLPAPRGPASRCLPAPALFSPHRGSLPALVPSLHPLPRQAPSPRNGRPRNHRVPHRPRRQARRRPQHADAGPHRASAWPALSTPDSIFHPEQDCPGHFARGKGVNPEPDGPLRLFPVFLLSRFKLPFSRSKSEALGADHLRVTRWRGGRSVFPWHHVFETGTHRFSRGDDRFV